MGLVVLSFLKVSSLPVPRVSRSGLKAATTATTCAEGEVGITGSKSRLLQTPMLQTLVGNGGASAVPTQGPQ
jgi:hypothetical protein